MEILYVILALLVFGFMILVHELGHFLFAKLFKVEINEFSIGMGPKLFSKKGRDNVQYSLRLFPIGGYVAMEGEGEESDNPNAFYKKPAWQRFVIVIAGAFVNLLVGSLIMTILTLSSPYYGTTIIAEFSENSVSEACGLEVGDEIIKVGNVRVHTYDELSYEIMRNGYAPVDITFVRKGEEYTKEVTFDTSISEGISFGKMDFKVLGERKSFSSVCKNAFYSTKSAIKMVWDSLIDLIIGRYGFEHVSGPIGVTGAISQAAQISPYSFFYMIVIISMNLGVFNLLPIPALDGGTLVFLIYEMIFKKPVPRKFESISKAITMVLLLLLVIVVTFKDIVNLF
ncbi:MAG: site-2 protease family protein [Clostridia bacterium]|nr:site-2 protease family protein [Clostridia bacterium]